MLRALFERIRTQPVTAEFVQEYANVDVTEPMMIFGQSYTLLEMAIINLRVDYARWLMEERRVRPCYIVVSALAGTPRYFYNDEATCAMWKLLFRHGAPCVLDVMIHCPAVNDNDQLLRAVVRRLKRTKTRYADTSGSPRWSRLVHEQQRCQQRALVTYAAAKRRLGRDLARTLAQAVWDRRLLQ